MQYTSRPTTLHYFHSLCMHPPHIIQQHLQIIKIIISKGFFLKLSHHSHLLALFSFISFIVLFNSFSSIHPIPFLITPSTIYFLLPCVASPCMQNKSSKNFSIMAFNQSFIIYCFTQGMRLTVAHSPSVSGNFGGLLEGIQGL